MILAYLILFLVVVVGIAAAIQADPKNQYKDHDNLS
ncbi:Uncharacterised protein [Moraxella caviae]|uniref:Uncharacterized protein n=1 Tax=Moraxella caviae TaxID=34060 RepID=A0A378R7H5_9GAMM|nr:Uncharacterised protein [Moraxella caviae]STZ14498.1 Uncharacterised protein [Moraxella caviae]VEW11322.1 Uncharacterised protein [Moraxella caviae]VEW12838.1 Uncharacterised protein [Moraxella caviae]